MTHLPTYGRTTRNPLRALRGGMVMLPVWLTLFAAVCQAVTGDVTLITLGGYNLQGPELSLIGFGVFLVTNYHRLQLYRSFILLLTLALMLLTVIATLRGTFENVGAAMVGIRAIVTLPLALSLYALLRPGSAFFQSIAKAIVFFATIVATIVYMRIILGPQFLMRAYTNASEINDGGRAVSASGALLIAVAAVILLSRVLEATKGSAGSHRRIMLLVFLAIGLTLSLQGTATISALVGSAIVFALAPGRGASLRFTVTIFAVMCASTIALLAPELLSVDFYIGLLPDDLAFHLGRRTGNLDTRTQVWSGFINSFEVRSTVDQLLGLPAGSRETITTAFQGGTYWIYGLHSGYFGMLSSLGIFGLAVFLVLLATISLTSIARMRYGGYPPPYLALALVCLILTFGYGYDWRNEQAIYILLAMGAVIPPRTTLTFE